MNSPWIPHEESNCRLTSQTKKARKMQNSFLPGHGEGNCRVINPDDVTDKKRRENAKQFSTWPWRRQLPRDQSWWRHRQKRRENAKQFSTWPWRRQLPRDQSYWHHRQKRARKRKTVFYLALEKAIAAWPILLTSQNKKRRENAEQFSTWPWRRQLPRDQSWHHRGTWWSLPPGAWPASPGRWGGRTSAIRQICRETTFKTMKTSICMTNFSRLWSFSNVSWGHSFRQFSAGCD